MRAVLQRRLEEEEELAFVSMTDMTVSFLFIVMILLAFFASQFHDPDKVARAEFDRVKQERDGLQTKVDYFRRSGPLLAAPGAGPNQIIRQREVRIHELRRSWIGRNRSRPTFRRLVATLQLQLQDQTEIIRQRENRIRELEEELKRLRPEQPIETYLAQVAEQRRRILEFSSIEVEGRLPRPAGRCQRGNRCSPLQGRWPVHFRFKRAEARQAADRRSHCSAP